MMLDHTQGSPTAPSLHPTLRALIFSVLVLLSEMAAKLKEVDFVMAAIAGMPCIPKELIVRLVLLPAAYRLQTSRADVSVSAQ